MLKTIDQPAYGDTAEAPARQAALQLEIYDAAPSDPESVLKVTQTLMADIPGVRLATDPKTGRLIALARPTEQATIRATIDQMRLDAQTVEVIQLDVIDPQLAALAIGKLFGREPDKGPSVDADVANRQLLVRGSADQIAQIRVLLRKMGEADSTESKCDSGKLRLLPVRDGEARQLFNRLKAMWPVVGDNELRIVPTEKIERPGQPGSRGTGRGLIDERTPVPGPPPQTESPDSPQSPHSTTRHQIPVRPTTNRRARVTFAATQLDSGDRPPTPPSPVAKSNKGKPPILVLFTPDGLYVSSEDVAALNELQKLANTLQGGSTPSASKLTVFYLRNAEAKTVAERLKELLASATPTPASGGTTSAPAPAGILGSLGVAGTLGRITPAGPISITPDSRLNALLIQAAPADVDLIEEILTVLDRRDSPEEIPAQPKPRLIPVLHTSASEIAQVVKEVYQNRMVGSSNSNPQTSQREMMMQMFRGRRGGDRPSNNTASADKNDTAPKMTIGVDSRSNSLVVSAPEPLFEEVRELVHALDRVAGEDNETVEVITLHDSNPEAVRAALSSLLGDLVKSSDTAPGAGTAAAGPTRGSWNPGGFTSRSNRRSGQPSLGPSSGQRQSRRGSSTSPGSQRGQRGGGRQ